MRYLLSILLLFSAGTAISQSDGFNEIEKAISQENYGSADIILQQKISKYFKLKQPDSLVNYIIFTGKTASGLKGGKSGTLAIKRLIAKIKMLAPDRATLMNAYKKSGEYEGSAGNNDEAYSDYTAASKYTNDKTPKSELASIENTLAVYAQRLGNIGLMLTHNRKCIRILMSDHSPDYEILYLAQNGIANSMYYQSKLDSAAYYYNEALISLDKTPRDSQNKNYSKAIILNNLSGVYNQQGNTQMAIETILKTIEKFENFSKVSDDRIKKQTAISLRFQAIDNLAGIYKELGDFQKARDLLEFSYKGKKENLQPDNPDIFISEILLGQLYFALRDDEKALQFTNEGIKNFERIAPQQHMWLGDGSNTLALIYEFKKKVTLAEKYYNKADSLYDLAMQGSYDYIYLDFLRNKSQFLAEHNKIEEARRVANKSARYIETTEGKESMSMFFQLLNLSKIEYLAGNYAAALSEADKGLQLINYKISKAGNLIDSIKMELNKPGAILYRNLARYQLSGNNNLIRVKEILAELDRAVEIIDRKKSYINDPVNNRILITEHAELFEFVKKLNLVLYKATNENSYLDKIITLQESALYSRIRSRLDKNDSIRFAYIPQVIRNREKSLNKALRDHWENPSNNHHGFKSYISIIDSINVFRKSLKKEYPYYYEMRYASVITSLGKIEHKIPKDITLVRYFYIDTSLYALVAGQTFKRIVQISGQDIESNLAEVNDPSSGIATISNALFNLYNILWKPVDGFVKHKRIMMIPDGILYNLNFEILTKEKIKYFRDIANYGLISKFTFSYQYSLFLIDQSTANSYSSSLFAGFAPGFTDVLKEHYKNNMKHGFLTDREYLDLLPQPFSLALLKKLSSIFGGKSFLNEDCTKEAFMDMAGNHRIIHVSTHAISNNLHPEFSKLIFAKNNYDQENELYAGDIYGCNLRSELTVLSACETGKPGFMDGEGMISLAHAFNYAGSKSLLTGLWKIDESASVMLLESFYKHLKKGLPKDEALRQAKLDFLRKQNGRILAPQYWAGLVILGDTSPISFASGQNYLLLWVAIGLFLLSVGIFLVKRKSKAVGY